MEVTAALLCGGRSSRMGEDKAQLLLDGVPLWRRQLQKLRFLEPGHLVISAREGQDFPGAKAEVLVDNTPDLGPIGGLHSVLSVTTQDHVVLLGVDLPLLPQEFLEELCDASFLGSGVVYRKGNRFEPLAAVYPSTLIGLVGAQIRDGDYSLQSLLRAAVDDGAMEALALASSKAHYFQNVNTREDFAALVAGGDEDGDETVATVPVIRCERSEAGVALSDEEPDAVAHESPMEIRVEGKSIAVVMRTPGHDEELALGFLVSEGVVTEPEDVFEVSMCPSAGEEGNVVDVLLRSPDSASLDQLTRHVFSSSSCGICGKATIESVFQSFPKLEQPLTVSAETLFTLPEIQREAQDTFEKTGGLHASALFDRFGKLVLLREDVGRHNALDKILGAGMLDRRLPFSDHVLLLSGRISFELMQKALAARIPVVAAVSAPSSLAVEFAKESGQTLCGFLRGDQMNVYAHPERLGMTSER